MTTYNTSLTRKQELFCIEYVKDHKVTEAAIRAGYSKRSAHVTGTRTLKRPIVKARIAQLMADASIDLSVSKIDSMFVVLNDEPNQQAIKDITNRLPNQEGRLLWGVLNNKGILTHRAISKFCCNNVPHVARRINTKILRYGLELVCKPQKIANSRMHSHEWYLCH
ncbi:MAG TPA: terminase small subunit [Methylococcaceae bacterium]|nr:terminase small subunit [Methylococcaceae bacterium]